MVEKANLETKAIIERIENNEQVTQEEVRRVLSVFLDCDR